LIPDGNNNQKNEQDKIGEKRGLRPRFTQGYRANIWRWGNSELFMRPMENLKEKDVSTPDKLVNAIEQVVI